MQPSILRNLAITYISFGLLMGVIFPFYAQFFVIWQEGMKIWFIIGCLIAGMTIGVVNFFLVKIVLLSKLARISTVANAISNKDITLQCTLESHDMIGQLVDSFNRMTANLRNIVSQIGDTITSLSHSSASLSHLTHESRSRITQQRGEAENMLNDIRDINRMIESVSESANEATHAAVDAKKFTENGQRSVDTTVRGIQNLATSVERAAEVINHLSKESDAIGSVLHVIREIADQTNLLALNAAIEAARAGESGRGFAVVADEVRSLASRTQQSTQEIQDMIERLQTGAKQAVDVMRSSRESAQRSVEQVAEAGQSLHSIASAVQNICDKNQEITRETQQQSAMASKVDDNLHHISRLMAQSVDDISQIAEAESKLGEFTHRLTAVIKDFRT
jgi:methyl-accepting chemotaxis protein